MSIIQDEEFGKITVRRSASSGHISLRVAPDGTIHASMPKLAPIFLVKRFIKSSREELRQAIKKYHPEYLYENGMQIGKSHTLIVHPTSNSQFSVSIHGQQIIAKIPKDININNQEVTRKIRDATITALRLEAKSYLNGRLLFLANKYGYSFAKTRFSHSSSRWGSCSSSGTISLNIALMKLPFDLIDYVIIHELSHTKHMNHSINFWNQVKIADPDYVKHRKMLKMHNPTI